MSSLAILPSLKRTLTDLEGDELYQVPSYSASHLPLPSVATTATEQQPQLIQQNLFNHDNGSVTSVDDLTYPVNHEMNPFNAYANPDVTIPIRPLTRRITTIDNDGDGGNFINSDSSNVNNAGAKQKPSTKDEYLLCNPNIEPSLVSNYPDDYDPLFVPNNLMSSSSIVPGFEHDYLYCQDFDDELIEEDLSDDDDDINQDYLLDDDMLDNHYDILQQQTNNNQFMVLDYLNDNNTNLNGGYIDNFGVKIDSNNQDSYSDNSQEIASISPLLPSDNLPLTPQSDDMQIDDEDFNPQTEVQEKPQVQTTHTKHNNHNLADHFCTLVNPSTGQACNKQFSRPYDLIRHQETIHAPKKKIFRCVICEGRLNGGPGNGKSKTFSRGDALSRHIKVKHGLLGKEAINLINEAKENVEYITQ